MKSMYRCASFSVDRTKRFELIRDWSNALEPEKTINFIGLNPSIADQQNDDPTVRKCIGFAKRWGYNRLIITNLIPTISTDPWKLPPWSGIDPTNRPFLLRWTHEAELVVVAWGNQPPALRRRIAIAEHILSLAELADPAPLYCIGTTKNGSPLHPSRTAYTDAPILWERAQ